MSPRKGRPPKAAGTVGEKHASTVVPQSVLDWYTRVAKKAGYRSRSAWMRSVLDEAAEKVIPRD